MYSAARVYASQAHEKPRQSHFIDQCGFFSHRLLVERSSTLVSHTWQQGKRLILIHPYKYCILHIPNRTHTHTHNRVIHNTNWCTSDIFKSF